MIRLWKTVYGYTYDHARIISLEFCAFYSYNKIETSYSQEVWIWHILKEIWKKRYYRYPVNMQPFLSLVQGKWEKTSFTSTDA